MKRLLAVALVVIMALSLCACCIKHDMAPATCTEPSTCTKCGKTEGEPLGHTEVTGEAVEPTCTEPGHTAETYCSVCGEVFVAAEEIPATGHDWIPATYFEPKTCRICGATEGEGLGNKLFENAIDAALLAAETASEDSAPSEAKSAPEEAAEERFGSIITLKGSTSGLGNADSIISGSSVIIKTDCAEDGTSVSELDIVINGSAPIKAVFTYKDGEAGLTLPGIDDKYYSFNIADFVGTLSDKVKDAGIDLSSGSSPAAAASKQAAEILRKYILTVLSVADADNVKESKGTYVFDAIDGETECRILSCTPDKDDWSTMIRKLASEAKSDKELASLLEAAMGASYDNNYSYQFYYDSKEDYISESMLALYDAIDEMNESADDIAETLAGYTLEIAYNGKRIHALKFRSAENGGGYESLGEPENGREDVIVLYSYGENAAALKNTVSAVDGKISGSLISDLFGISLTYDVNCEAKAGASLFDAALNAGTVAISAAGTALENGADTAVRFDFGQFSGELDVGYIKEDIDLKVPETEKTVIKDTDGFGEAFVSILTGLYQSGIFGYISDEVIA